VLELIAQAYSAMDEALYTVATEAGPRLSEIRGMKVRNVDFKVGVLRFEDGFTTSSGHAGNKGRRVRSVPMTANVRAALRPFCEGKAGDELVFEHDAKPGEPICGVGLYRRCVKAAERAGQPRLRLHDLRHTFGTQFRHFSKRRRPESNRCKRLCRPLRSHSATSPRRLSEYRAVATLGLIQGD
jgi:integrase